MSKIKQFSRSFRLTLLFAFFVFIILVVTMAFMTFGSFTLFHFNLMGEMDFQRLPLFMFAVVSVITGTIIALIVSRKPLAPLTEIMDAADKITEGDYSVRIRPRGPEQLHQLGEKFNRMAAELEHVEIMRNDFIQNFSHEFKTPIVSICGFAKALKWNDLTENEKTEYLDIIIDESQRLSDLATNVLYLSKIEKQTILSGRTSFNLCEQIRLVVALLDKKLEQKNLILEMDSDEIFYTGNPAMLRQVWINLLDNAIKFSPKGGRIKITVRETTEGIQTAITDKGNGMSKEVMAHIFDKFYQGDTSRSTVGNGLGLTIVKKIIDLHGGKIEVFSSEQGSSFYVLLK